MSYWEQQKDKKQDPKRVKADRTKLRSPSISVPDVYDDERSKCRDCKEAFTFTAREQQVWYERFGIPHEAKRVRCFDCAVRHKESLSLKNAFDQACLEAKKNDVGYDVLLNASMAACAYGEELPSAFKIERVVSWLRACQKERPSAAEPLYWLAFSYDISGRQQKAAEFYAAYLEKTGEVKQGPMKKWRGLAEKRIVALKG
jgi:hypothetical protein